MWNTQGQSSIVSPEYPDMASPAPKDAPAAPAAGRAFPRDDLERRRQFREFFLALRRGYVLGHCRTCETFYVMARLCLEEEAGVLRGEERAEAASWVEAGSVLELEFGCEGACALVPLYARIAREAGPVD